MSKLERELNYEVVVPNVTPGQVINRLLADPNNEELRAILERQSKYLAMQVKGQPNAPESRQVINQTLEAFSQAYPR